MIQKFAPAITGLLDGFQHPAIRLQWVLACLTILAGIILHLEFQEWCFVLIAIGMVLVAEVFNTCVEKLCDLYSLEQNEKIRAIKDLSAGSVLIASLMALVLAIIILLRHI